MKWLALVFSSAAFTAFGTELRSGDLRLYDAQAEIVGVASVCPSQPGRPTCAAYGSLVTVEVQLNGCADRLAGTFDRLDKINGVGRLHFGALAVATEDSQRIRCEELPTVLVTVRVGHMGEFLLVPMPFDKFEE